ncbi:hypothetical protein [uncultured Phascolarctobacterium sp.]|uniref:hypothetical protein n=1 Tax=uncultured Phascolarctobacterium sp. TaxID=512296 RepID=UPI0027D94621|nr:hypothetical protein [uncultured Phascolarctobacterium sp.]
MYIRGERLSQERRRSLKQQAMPAAMLSAQQIQRIAIVVPPMLTFYNGSNSVEKQMQHIIGKVLMQFGIDYKHFVAWKGES